MQASTYRVAAIAAFAAAVALGVALAPSAQSQMRANPSFQPVGVSASGAGSTAWFHDPASGRAIACQTTGTTPTGPSGIHCVAAKLPQEGS